MRRGLSAAELLAGAALAIAMVYAGISLSWPVLHDLRILLYEGFLIADLGRMPYRDFFDFNPPGTLLLSAQMHRLTGGRPEALRALDLLTLAAIGVATWRALRPRGHASGVFAAAVFAIVYFACGPYNTLQREFLAILPLAVAAALLLTEPPPGAPRWLRLLLAGALAGLVFTVKPPLVLCWLPLLGYAASGPEAGRGWRRLRCLVPAAAGGLLGALPAALWLGLNGAGGPFLEMVVGYYPLYTRIDGLGQVHAGGVADLFERFVLKTAPLLLQPLWPLALLGIYHAHRQGERRLAAAHAFFVLSALLYVPLSGKFWLYHQIPMFYALALAAGLLLREKPGLSAPVPMLLLAVVAGLPWGQLSADLLAAGRAQDGGEDAVAGLTAWLSGAPPETTVMPLDTTSAAVHAMYLARRPLYGRFIYDFHFYHHGGDPYIARLRREMLDQLAAPGPELVLQCPSWRPEPRGPEDLFPELAARLGERYRPARSIQDCTVWSRR